MHIYTEVSQDIFKSKNLTDDDVKEFVQRLDEIVGDEEHECEVKYERLANDFHDTGLNFAAGMVDSIRTDECRHAELYRQIRSALISAPLQKKLGLM